MWHRQVIKVLEASGIFSEVRLVGGKVRATIDANRFLDIHLYRTRRQEASVSKE